MNLLLTRPENVAPDGVFSASEEQTEHLRNVLREKPGGTVRAGMLGGRIGTAEILTLEKHRAVLRFLSLDRASPPERNLRFAIALPRPQSFKKCLHFLASAGIPEASFLQTSRVEKSYWKSAALSEQAVEKEIFLGLEQGGSTRPPELHFFHTFREWKNSLLMEKRPENERRIAAHPAPDALPCPAPDASVPVLAAIGPEGGFIPEEIDALQELEFRCVTLGTHILRVEFALAFLAGKLS